MSPYVYWKSILLPKARLIRNLAIMKGQSSSQKFLMGGFFSSLNFLAGIYGGILIFTDSNFLVAAISVHFQDHFY